MSLVHVYSRSAIRSLRWAAPQSIWQTLVSLFLPADGVTYAYETVQTDSGPVKDRLVHFDRRPHGNVRYRLLTLEEEEEEYLRREAW